MDSLDDLLGPITERANDRTLAGLMHGHARALVGTALHEPALLTPTRIRELSAVLADGVRAVEDRDRLLMAIRLLQSQVLQYETLLYREFPPPTYH